MVLHGKTPEEDLITKGRLMLNGSLLNLKETATILIRM